MQHKESLEKILEKHWGWHKSRLGFAACLVLSLVQQKTVNFVSLSLAFGSEAKAASSYRRIQRFFQGFEFSQTQVSQLILKLLPAPPYTVCLDRTNWQFGKFKINILMLSIAYQGIAFPICWQLLAKKGNSNTTERKQLMTTFLHLVPLQQIDMVVADREFVGKDWFAYLTTMNIPFVIRIRQDALADGWFSVICFFQTLPLGESKLLQHRYRIFGSQLALCGLRLQGDYLILVTNRSPKQALAFYKRRWQIEMLFAAMKTTGFDLESSHLACPQRMDKLLAFVCLAVTWAHSVGEWLQRTNLKPLRLKAHGRREKTFFRHGLDYLRSLLCNPLARFSDLLPCIHLLSCT
jgi:Transposase DDE domain